MKLIEGGEIVTHGSLFSANLIILEGGKKIVKTLPKCDSARAFVALVGIDDATCNIMLEQVTFI